MCSFLHFTPTSNLHSLVPFNSKQQTTQILNRSFNASIRPIITLASAWRSVMPVKSPRIFCNNNCGIVHALFFSATLQVKYYISSLIIIITYTTIHSATNKRHASSRFLINTFNRLEARSPFCKKYHSINSPNFLHTS